MSSAGLNPGWRIAAGGLAWLAGLGLQLQQPVLWPQAHYALGGAAALLAAALAWRARRAHVRSAGVAGLLALLVLAFCSTGWRAGLRLADALAPALEGRNLLVTGVVATMPQTGATGTRFQLAVESATLDGRPVRLPRRLALAWYAAGEADDPAPPESAAALRAGQRWRLPVRLKRPHGAMNPGGFDTELWLWERGLRATGHVRQARSAPPPRLLGDSGAYPVERARQVLRDRLVRTVAEPRSAGVLAALVVGDQAAIEREDWDLFRNTGTAHLVSISGIHVTMFAWLAGGLIGRAWRHSARLALWLPAPLAGRWGGLLVAAGYALLAGWGVPAVRTLLMLAMAVLLHSAGLRWPWLRVLLAAAVVVTLADPWALLQAGFWQSFAAVGLLLASQATAAPAPRTGWRGAATGLLRSQAVATLGLAPLSLVFFQQVSLVGFLANLLAIPLVTLLITPLALLGVLVPPLWGLAAALVQALAAALAWLAAWPGAVWVVPAAPAWGVACGLLAAVLGLLPLPRRVRLLALPLVLPLLVPAVPRPAEGRFELVAADVGQGTAVLLRTRGHLLLYDTGPMYGSDSDAGQRLLLPLLRARGERQVDLLMLSHRDSDHTGGAASLMRALPVRVLSSALEAGHALRAAGPPHTACVAGQAWTWDGVRFEVLHPGAEALAAPRSSNAVSCVLRVVDAAGRSVLLAGDIESPEEAALVRRLGPALRSDLLLVPHHGSRTSSSAAWLDAVAPTVALVQAGYRSRFGHPAPEVLQRHAARGIPVVRSDQCGAWLWHDGAAACTRDVRRRYWHWTPPEAGADVANPSAGVGNP